MGFLIPNWENIKKKFRELEKQKVEKKNIKIMKFKILEVRDGSFKGEEGNVVPGSWIKAQREDGVKIEFWTPNKYKTGDNRELDLEKRERRNGKIGYTDLTK